MADDCLSMKHVSQYLILDMIRAMNTHYYVAD